MHVFLINIYISQIELNMLAKQNCESKSAKSEQSKIAAAWSEMCKVKALDLLNMALSVSKSSVVMNRWAECSLSRSLL